MSKQVFPVSHRIENIFLGFASVYLLFLWLHDWIPLGRLNDVAAVRSQGPVLGLVVVTTIQSVSFSIGLWFSVLYLWQPCPHCYTRGFGSTTASTL